MLLSRRCLAPGELDHELVWLSVSIASLGAAASWFALGLPWPRCMFRAITGLPCVTCGSTRSAIEFLHGHFFAAWTWNPLAFCGLCAVILFDVYALIALVAHAPRWRIAFRKQAEKKCMRMVVVAALALNWIYLLAHWRNF